MGSLRLFCGEELTGLLLLHVLAAGARASTDLLVVCLAWLRLSAVATVGQLLGILRV